MSLKETIFIHHPTLCFVPVSALLALVAITPRPAFFPLVFLLSSLQLYGRITIMIRREGGIAFFTLWAALTVAVALAHLAPSLQALSTPGVSLVFLSLVSAVTSCLALAIVFADIRFCMSMKTPWSQITLLPALWASLWAAISHISPVGRLATWSPVMDLGPYDWTRQVFGPWGIDWLVAAWSVVIAQAVGAWFVGSAPDLVEIADEQLISHELPENESLMYARSSTSTTSRSRHILFLGCVLLGLMIPSYVLPEVPLPLYSEETTPLTVACVLPRSRNLKNGPALLQDYIKESMTLDQAKIQLWPEGAVRFDSYDAKAAAIEQVRAKVAFNNHWVGISFEEVIPNLHGPGSQRRNGLVLVGKNGPVLEYYKRNLVPVAESFSLTASSDPPTVFSLPLTRPSDITKGEWGNLTRPIPLSASICLDFSSPTAFTPLDSRPALILAPARTWHTSVGLAMFEQAKARALEAGSMVLWCDGGDGGVSGIVGGGMNEIMQVGDGSWMRTIGVQYPFDERRTPFMWGGEWMAVVVVWAILGAGWVGELVITGRGVDGAPLKSAVGSVGRLARAWKEGRARVRVGEEQSLLG